MRRGSRLREGGRDRGWKCESGRWRGGYGEGEASEREREVEMHDGYTLQVRGPRRNERVGGSEMSLRARTHGVEARVAARGPIRGALPLLAICMHFRSRLCSRAVGVCPSARTAHDHLRVGLSEGTRTPLTVWRRSVGPPPRTDPASLFLYSPTTKLHHSHLRTLSDSTLWSPQLAPRL